ncbi:MAG: hypothetical protein EOO45_18880 [Flavobacterium sp.]|nr:MAG: hypothetical protein EOO45_18880 [Flavobacterium sp.]
MLDRKPRYSVLNPYFDNPESNSEYIFTLGYTTPEHKKLHELVFSNIAGVIASDIDYVLPLQGHQKFLGLIANPVNFDKVSYNELQIRDRIVIFMGINRWNYRQKGIRFFEEALEIVQSIYNDKIEVIVTESIPYAQYITLYDRAHILLDQVYGYDQGYNALEAMAKGKVVFTGAEKEFTDHYGLTGRVAVNALPDVAALVEELSYLIENPEEIKAIGRRARAFIVKEHNYANVARRYVETWNNN